MDVRARDLTMATPTDMRSDIGDGSLSNIQMCRPVYKALHRPLTVCGVDRRLFFLSLLLGVATFNLFYSFLAGLLVFGVLYGFALHATSRDPEMLRILFASSRARRRYDPGKHQRGAKESWPW